MLFNSVEFFVFLTAVLTVYYCLGWRWQNYWLLAASYVFYGWWDWRFVFLLAGSTGFNYICGAWIAQATEACKKKILILNVAANLGLLGIFKYFNFFCDSFVAAFALLGLELPVPAVQIVLPVGISFFTFQCLSYTVDIYRGQTKPEPSLLTFALYVSFFPQLVAGPIERSTRLLPQLLGPRRVEWPNLGRGVELILLGLFKKVGVADAFAPLVDLRFRNPELASGADLLMAAYLFSIQIYCDFSGYTDIARGVGKLLGIDLMKNFQQPYLSRNPTEFWRRWHISLSTWLRDYLYIPLGGNRKGVRATYRNLMITMLLGGLWHGANWTFVVWGGLHGVYLALHKAWTEVRQGAQGVLERRKSSPWMRVAQVIAMFHLVTFTWIFFRSETLGAALRYCTGLLRWQPGSGAFKAIAVTSPRIWALVLLMLVIDVSQYWAGRHTVMLRLAWPVRGIAYAGLMATVLILGGVYGQVPFIYFQF
ncbi:MBOAT family O-acyltransferase [Deferrisoma camini]|uniref:MBOAT family O-acyltransferase n=1 Tax=Deferrisoma camini TaxID=1035120 RepID=UPI00046CC54A|nr:MBOAT family protein [Deferrisoma camini]